MPGDHVDNGVAERSSRRTHSRKAFGGRLQGCRRHDRPAKQAPSGECLQGLVPAVGFCRRPEGVDDLIEHRQLRGEDLLDIRDEQRATRDLLEGLFDPTGSGKLPDMSYDGVYSSKFAGKDMQDHFVDGAGMVLADELDGEGPKKVRTKKKGGGHKKLKERMHTNSMALSGEIIVPEFKIEWDNSAKPKPKPRDRDGLFAHESRLWDSSRLNHVLFGRGVPRPDSVDQLLFSR